METTTKVVNAGIATDSKDRKLMPRASPWKERPFAPLNPTVTQEAANDGKSPSTNALSDATREDATTTATDSTKRRGHNLAVAPNIWTMTHLDVEVKWHHTDNRNGLWPNTIYPSERPRVLSSIDDNLPLTPTIVVRFLATMTTTVLHQQSIVRS